MRRPGESPLVGTWRIRYSQPMQQGDRLPRSPQLLGRHDSALLVVDAQQKLLNLIPGQQRIEWNIGRLIDGAGLLGVPVVATEQYPAGLGPTAASIRAKLQQVQAPIVAKLAFSCGEAGDMFRDLAGRGIYKILLAGIEAHVCVFQTAMDLAAEGFDVHLAVDAIGARSAQDRDVALQRLDSAGATLSTTEMALFEWCDVAGSPEFKQISALVRQAGPDASGDLSGSGAHENTSGTGHCATTDAASNIVR